MIRPQSEEAKKYLSNYTVIPVYKEIFADVKTSVEVVKNFMTKNERSFLLESVGNSESWGRYSFIGYNPKLTVRCMDDKIVIDGQKNEEITTNNPVICLRNIISQYKSPRFEILPPFTGGFVGYFSYDFYKYNEKSVNLLNSNKDNFDDFYLMLFDTVVAFDHLKQKIFIVVNTPVENFANEFKKTEEKIEEIEELIRSTVVKKEQISKLKSNFKMFHSREEFKEMVEKIKQHIFEGDIFQAVLSNRAEAYFEGSLLKTYRILRTINPSPYMFYLNFGDIEIAGASPETLVTLKDRELTNYALAGTCRRGKNDDEDKVLISQLLKDEKEMAEHNMLVDLARNDLGKVSEFASVKVVEHMKVLKFSHVSHMASLIKSKIKAQYDHLDALSAVLPAGTLSGAPKKMACEIINKLEKHKRGTYGGAIGYIDFAGNMDMCIAIRMAKFENGKVYVQSGAGIVTDSNPEKEYDECCQKAQVIINALNLAQTEEL